jgi:hypothetical protein
MRLFVFSACVLGLTSAFASGCSAVIDPDTNRLNDDTGVARDASVVPGNDGGGLVDAWIAPGTDGGAPSDAWTAPGVDAWVPPNDAWVPPLRDTGPVCVPGVECAGWSSTLGAAPRDAAGATPALALMNCVIQIHRSDCCGARDALGINHGARATLCAAETSCDAMYPPATCSDDNITTDTGETTRNANNVRLRVVNPRPCPGSIAGTCYTCETFVCTSDPCRSAPGIAGGCGG